MRSTTPSQDAAGSGRSRCFSAGRFRIAVFRDRDDNAPALDNAGAHQGPMAGRTVGIPSVAWPLHVNRFRLANGSQVNQAAGKFAFDDDVVLVEIRSVPQKCVQSGGLG